jgi:alkylhydroperoxidase/carboxymuconolactone decarboxylase family protein YurZ
MDNHIKRMIAIGAPVAANCHSCLHYNRNKALEDGVIEQDITESIEIGKMVSKKAAAKMDEFASNLSPINSYKKNECVCKG